MLLPLKKKAILGERGKHNPEVEKKVLHNENI